MSTEPSEELPSAATVEVPKEARAVIFTGQKVTIAGKEFKMECNTVISGLRVDIVAAGLKPE